MTSSSDAQLRWLAQSEEEAVHDDLHQLLTETRGVLEKLADSNLKLGSWQMVLWQPRWVYAETDGMCYQKVSTNDKPIGKAKKILFSAIKDLEELECQEFRVICPDRDFTFKVPETGNSCSCSVMVHNLRQLMLRHREATLSGA